MKVKTVAFMVLLIFAASAFAITSTLPELAKNPNIDTNTICFGGGHVQPYGDPIGGGPGGGRR